MDVKVVLTLIVPGAVMVEQEPAKRLTKDDFEVSLMPVEFKDSKGKYVKDNLVVRTRKTKDVVKKLKMDRVAYEHMLETPVDPKMTSKWKSTRNNDRLRYHFEQIAKDMGAKSYTFEVLED